MKTSPNVASLALAAALALAPAVALVALVPSASAQTVQSASPPASISVSIGDVNVATPQGAKVAQERIEQAARKVCDAAVVRSPLEPRGVADCAQKTAENAMADLRVTTIASAK